MSSILALGFFTSSRATFPTYMVFASLAIYPAALALVYFLDYVVGQFYPPRPIPPSAINLRSRMHPVSMLRSLQFEPISPASA
jgi:hypothetical protein